MFTSNRLSAATVVAFGLSPLMAFAGAAGDGLGADSAAASCRAIHQRSPAAGDGTYWVAKSGRAAVQVYCDMGTGGWQVLFNSHNPRHWGETFGAPGSDEWSIDDNGAPDEITELRLMRRDTRERKIIPITAAALYNCSFVGDRYYWNGTKYRTWNAINLGISTKKNIYPPPEGYVLSGPPCNNDHKSWGFGHRAWIDDRQGWGWNSLDLGQTVFQIAVR